MPVSKLSVVEKTVPRLYVTLDPGLELDLLDLLASMEQMKVAADQNQAFYPRSGPLLIYFCNNQIVRMPNGGAVCYAGKNFYDFLYKLQGLAAAASSEKNNTNQPPVPQHK